MSVTLQSVNVCVFQSRVQLAYELDFASATFVVQALGRTNIGRSRAPPNLAIYTYPNYLPGVVVFGHSYKEFHKFTKAQGINTECAVC
jgi:hypothetical protein